MCLLMTKALTSQCCINIQTEKARRQYTLTYITAGGKWTLYDYNMEQRSGDALLYLL